MRKRFAIFFLLGHALLAQLPETEIFLAKIEIKNNLIKLGETQNITNRKGYDNQPSFTKDDKAIYFSAEFVDATGKTRVSISTINVKGKYANIPGTGRKMEGALGLYSPMETPDGKLSCVVVEKDSTQRIWVADIAPPYGDKCLTENTDSIGYYGWVGKDTIMYYKLTDPHSLRVLNLKTGEDNWLCDHPTRSFRKINNKTLFYVIHEEKENLLFFYDIHTKKASLFANDKPENQDYVWLDGLGMLKSEESKLLRYSTDTKVWVEVCDFSASGIKKITRFAFSHDKKYVTIVSNL